MKELAWVLGASGLLGSALVRALGAGGAGLHQIAARLPWHDEAAALALIQAEAAAFAERAAGCERWTVLWAAGVGAMNSLPEALAAEERLLGALLGALKAHALLRALPGAVVFASSAGALYGGAAAACYRESSPVSLSLKFHRVPIKPEPLSLSLKPIVQFLALAEMLVYARPTFIVCNNNY